MAVKDRLMKIFINARNEVIKRLSNEKVALTTDLLTSLNNIAFMGITLSLFTEKFKPVDLVIGFKQVLGEYSGSNIAKHFYDHLTLFEVQNNVKIFIKNLICQCRLCSHANYCHIIFTRYYL